MFLRVDIKDPKTAKTKTVAKARMVKGFTPAAKANKLIQALDKNPTNSKLVLSNYSRATADDFPAIQAWEDNKQAVEAIRERTYRRGKDAKPRQVSPNSLASLKSFNKDTRPNKPKTDRPGKSRGAMGRKRKGGSALDP
jgi:hypothetical protein